MVFLVFWGVSGCVWLQRCDTSGCMGMQWDVALVRHATSSGESLMIRFPVVLARALNERGLNRARLMVTEDGILVVPFAGLKGRSAVELPEGWGG